MPVEALKTAGNMLQVTTIPPEAATRGNSEEWISLLRLNFLLVCLPLELERQGGNVLFGHVSIWKKMFSTEDLLGENMQKERKKQTRGRNDPLCKPTIDSLIFETAFTFCMAMLKILEQGKANQANFCPNTVKSRISGTCIKQKILTKPPRIPLGNQQKDERRDTVRCLKLTIKTVRTPCGVPLPTQLTAKTPDWPVAKGRMNWKLVILLVVHQRLVEGEYCLASMMLIYFFLFLFRLFAFSFTFCHIFCEKISLRILRLSQELLKKSVKDKTSLWQQPTLLRLLVHGKDGSISKKQGFLCPDVNSLHEESNFWHKWDKNRKINAILLSKASCFNATKGVV